MDDKSLPEILREKREELFNRYKEELIFYNKNFKIISGKDFNVRFQKAINYIEKFQ